MNSLHFDENLQRVHLFTRNLAGVFGVIFEAPGPAIVLADFSGHDLRVTIVDGAQGHRGRAMEANAFLTPAVLLVIRGMDKLMNKRGVQDTLIE